jgi:flavin-dependent dehydrogenase
LQDLTMTEAFAVTTNSEYSDILIIGAGLAGGCLARQLRFQFPDLSIRVLDKKASFDGWVGESTLCAFVDYATRHCRLGPYLVKHHMIKHGLRFFFDSEDASLPVHELSEDGRVGFHPLLSIQLDRATFDRDLCQLNQEVGIDVLLDTKVVPRSGNNVGDAVHLDGKQGHVVHTSRGMFCCRWLVDAGGRSSILARKLGLVPTDDRLPVASYWSRYEGCRNIDELGDDEWRRRVKYTQRYLSTNHFTYRGYWIWLIPVSDETVSIGVCYNREMVQANIRNADDLTDFLRKHRCMRDILGERARPTDFFGLKHIPRGAKQMFSEDRWFLTGMSGNIVDPLFSTTCNLISYSNRLIGEMIRSDLSQDHERFKSQVRHFDIWMRLKYEALIAAFKYERIGSFDAWPIWRIPLQSKHFNSVLPGSFEDLRSLIELVDRHRKTGCDCSFEAQRQALIEHGLHAATNRLTDEFIRFLDEHGMYWARNRGGFKDGKEPDSITEKLMNPKRDLEREHIEDLAVYRSAMAYSVRRMAEIRDVRFDQAVFDRWFDPSWESGQTAAEGLRALERASSSPRLDPPSESQRPRDTNGPAPDELARISDLFA